MVGKSIMSGSVDSWLLPHAARILFFLGLAVSALDHASHDRGFGLTVTTILGLALLIVGLSFYFVSRFYLGRFFSERIRIRPDHKLIEKGPHRYVRHPIYLAEMLYFLSIPVIFESVYGLVIMLVIVPLLLLRMGNEEKALSAEFGPEYER